MKIGQTGRINERNTGSWSLEGNPKRRNKKAITEEIESDEVSLARESLQKINMIFSGGVTIYDSGIPEIVQQWISKGIAVIKNVDNPCVMARKMQSKRDVAFLVEKYRKDLELVRGLLIHFYKL